MSAKAMQLLLVEDDEEDYLLTQKLLSGTRRISFDITWVRSGAEALRALQQPFDVCLVDYHLGADTGLGLIPQAISQGFRGPMILLTGRGDDDIDIQAMKAGAADYLVKGELTTQLLERIIAHALERRASQLALSHSEEQLRQAQKMEAIGSLAGGIAHDFNNLLSIVLSYSDLLALGLAEDDPMRADLAQISQAGQRAAGLTHQLLAFSHQQVLKPEVLDLNQIVERMRIMLARLIGEGIELTARVAPHLLSIKADPGQLEQVIMNLVINARDAMPDGGTLTLETSDVVLDEAYASSHMGVNAGRHVRLTVSDTGTGMDHPTLSRIFEPFFTTKVLGKGTGLGLATVFGIVRQSGASIRVDSTLGGGSKFSVFFPVAEGAPSPRVEAAPLERRSLFGSETILLVEDEVSLRALVRTILHKYGYKVLEAHSGGDALLLCEQYGEVIDLLLTDVVMPRMNGRQLAERLRQVRPGMRVLYMSGYTNDEVVRHGVFESELSFIQKPLTPAVLARKMRETLELPEPTQARSGVMPVAQQVADAGS